MSLKKLDLDSVRVTGIFGESIIPNKPKGKDKAADESDRKLTSKRKDEDSVNEEFDYIYVGNIPSDFKSADLRFFFIDYIEKGAFLCFHYRHRPETQVIKDDDATRESTTDMNVNNDGIHSVATDTENEKIILDKGVISCCCIVKCRKAFFYNFLQRYRSKEWRSAALKFTKTRVNIRKLEVGSNPKKAYQTKGEISSERHEIDQELYLEDFKNLIELNPPTNVMPNGNVGTTTKYFHRMISECLLPTSVIKKLGLNFPKSSKRQYSSVRMEYEDRYNARAGTSNAQGMKDSNSSDDEKDKKSKEDDEKREDDGAEEWDRYEALHDDVDNQARPKERLFEEDLEVKWEKGGSGLVFYTDAYFWNEMKGKDFDEDTVDDWDVDYSVYYEDEAGDKPSRDQLNMRLQKRRREGKTEGPTKYSEIRRKEKRNREKMTDGFAQFEKYSNAFGSRILKKQGWKEGDGVGCKMQGIKEPVDIEGQLARKRIGLGYNGEKLDRSVSLKRVAEKDVYISTKYDDKDGEQIDAMRFHGMELLKYRTPKIDFENAEKKVKAIHENLSDVS